MSHILPKASISVILVLIVMLALILPASAQDTVDSDQVSLRRLAISQEEGEGVLIDTLVVESTPVETSKDARATIINDVETLTPTTPNSKDLEQYLDTLLDDVISDDMTHYQKVRSCYDYLVSNTRYGSHMRYSGTQIGNVTAQQIINRYGTVEGYGAIVLGSQVGYCNAYASAFILMARNLGFDASLVKGATKGAGGYYVPHQWAEININGTRYVFDPQLEQNLTQAGLGTYNVFCKTYDQVPGRYIIY